MQEKQDVWEIFGSTPEPLGWGADGLAGFGPGRWLSPLFTPLRLQPWRADAASRSCDRGDVPHSQIAASGGRRA